MPPVWQKNRKLIVGSVRDRRFFGFGGDAKRGGASEVEDFQPQGGAKIAQKKRGFTAGEFHFFALLVPFCGSTLKVWRSAFSADGFAVRWGLGDFAVLRVFWHNPR